MGKSNTRNKKNRRRRVRPFAISLMIWMLYTILAIFAGVMLAGMSMLPGRLKLLASAVLAVTVLLLALFTFGFFKKKHTKVAITLNSVFLVLMCLAGIVGLNLYNSAKRLLPSVNTLKASLKAIPGDLSGDDIVSARANVDQIDSSIDDIRNEMDSPIWHVVSAVPEIGKNVRSAENLLDIADDANQKILSPGIDLMEATPLSTIKSESGGFNVLTINAYLDFADQVMPEINTIENQLKDVDLSLTGMQDELVSYEKKIDETVDMFETYEQPLRDIIGDGTENRMYLLAAQNLAEGRALGGFVGSCGTVTVQNGVMDISDFNPVMKVLTAGAVPASVAQTADEQRIFYNLMADPRNPNFSMDFKRCGEIWSAEYYQSHYVQLDGVIAMNPSILQKILSALGQSVTLSDGTEMDGSNAMRVITRDLNYKYMNSDMDLGIASAGERNDETDSLYGEAANSVMDVFKNSFSFSNMTKILPMFIDSFKDKTIMVWMQDEDQEQHMVDAGMGGELVSERKKSYTGIWWSYTHAAKFGWFMDLKTEVSDPVTNEDGTKTYNVSADITDIFTDEDMNGAGLYILGRTNNDGSLIGVMHLTAPVDGKISNVQLSNGLEMTEDNYQGVQIFRAFDLRIHPGDTLTVTWQVTTAPDAGPLQVETTPTCTNYR
ncbi:MAG: DUF4012 domain-containing protein [Erysipelotrichaceae bacterium]|nr:DUF4012 domain-containing protein [Erysipelotrichaceae bacterium]